MPRVPREEQLENQLNVLRKVAGGIAHQSKSPLNSIAINAFILREKIKPIADRNKEAEILFSFLTSIESDVRRLDGMLDMFFHFLREDGKPESYSVPELVQECIDLLYHLATKNNCPLTLSTKETIEIFGNKAMVRRIIVSTLLALLPTNSGLDVEISRSRERISVATVAVTADPANPMADSLLQLASEFTSQIQGDFRADPAEKGKHHFEILLRPEKTADV